MIRVGMVGLGLISAAHGHGYELEKDAVEVAAVCDKADDLAEVRAKVIGCKAYVDYDAFLADPTVDVVDLMVPHHLHYEMARAALEAGKHVLVEKPLANSSAEASDLLELAMSKGLVISVAENTRFVAAYLALQKILEDGRIGDVRLIRTFIAGSEVVRLSDPTLWKGSRTGAGGGTIMDAGAHSFYLLRWLFGDIKKVRAIQYKLVPESEVEDHAIVSGTLDTGAIFSSEFTFTAEIPWTERLEVYGSTGSVIIDQLADPPAVWYRDEWDAKGTPLEGVGSDVFGWKLHSIADGVRDFARAIAEKRPPLVEAEVGVFALRVIERAYESVAQDGKELEV